MDEAYPIIVVNPHPVAISNDCSHLSLENIDINLENPYNDMQNLSERVATQVQLTTQMAYRDAAQMEAVKELKRRGLYNSLEATSKGTHYLSNISMYEIEE